MSACMETDCKLSVVVAAWGDGPELQRCLASLSDQENASDTEIIVVSNDGGRLTESMKRQFPQVRYISLPEQTTVPELRAEGINHASGEVIALTEDNCVIDKRWCAEINRAHNSPHQIIGGSVENISVGGPLNWAVYFYEYGKYMLPNDPGVVECLPGNNVSYKRSVFTEVADHLREGFFETFIHQELKKRGHTLYLAPSAVVFHQKSYRLKKAIKQCYHSGRSFAGIRAAQVPLARRLGLTIGSLALPLILPLRIAMRTVRKGTHIRELLISLPYLLSLMTSWSCGELCGYVFGEGNSTSQWK